MVYNQNIYEFNWLHHQCSNKVALLTSRHQSNTDINQSSILLPVCKSTPQKMEKKLKTKYANFGFFSIFCEPQNEALK